MYVLVPAIPTAACPICERNRIRTVIRVEFDHWGVLNENGNRCEHYAGAERIDARIYIRFEEKLSCNGKLSRR